MLERINLAAALNRTVRIAPAAGGYVDVATGRQLDSGVGPSASADVMLLLPVRDVLVRRQLLPRAVMGRLREVLRLEIAADMPFEADDVLWDYRLVSTHSEAGMIEVELAFAERARVLRAAEQVRIELGTRLAGVDRLNVEGTGGQGFNLLPLPERKPRLPIVSTFNQIVLAACVAAIVMATFAATYGEARQLDIAEEEAQSLRALTSDVIQTRAAFREARARLDKVMAAKHRWPAHVSIIAELSRILPDAASLNEVRIEDGQVDLLGQADRAVDLVPMLESSPLFANPRFASPVMSDTRSRKEKFQIALDLVEEAV